MQAAYNVWTKKNDQTKCDMESWVGGGGMGGGAGGGEAPEYISMKDACITGHTLHTQITE